MAETEEVTVALPAPVAERIRAAVEAGEYASTGEVVREALRLRETRSKSRERELESLRRAIDQGRESGTAGPLDMADLLARSQRRAKAARR